jgi:uncharacterized protein
MSVDVPRQRIGLTLRLDDEVPAPGAAGERRRPQERPAGDRQGGARQGGPRQDATRQGGPRQGPRGGGGRPEPEPQGALADALRRAGLA